MSIAFYPRIERIAWFMTVLVCLRVYDLRYLNMLATFYLLTVEVVLIGIINIGTTIMVLLEML